MGVLGRSLLVLAVLVIGGCTLDLAPRVSCGDGFHDQLAGEECDPGDPQTFEHACAETRFFLGDAQCDPDACIILADEPECCACGDGVISPGCGEECEPGLPVPSDCAGGWPGMKCGSDCKLDTSECPDCECSPGFEVPDSLAGEPLACADIAPFINGRDYEHGSVGWCGADCYFDRSDCSYCGDGRLDLDPQPIWFGMETNPEWCDGEQIDENKLANARFQWLVDECSQYPDARPNVECTERCDDFVLNPNEPQCCLREYAHCPAAGDPLRCCYELAHAGEEPCMPHTDWLTDLVQDVCRPPPSD